MKFFDRCFRKATMADVSGKNDRDIAFNNFLKKHHEARERERAATQRKANIKEKIIDGKKTGNC